MAELQPLSWDRLVRAVEDVRIRLLRATAAMEEAKIPYAMIGGQAVGAWVRSVDDGADRNSPNVDLLLRRADIELARGVLSQAGFQPAEQFNDLGFIDGGRAARRADVQIYVAGEKIKPSYLDAAPDVDDSVVEYQGKFRILRLRELTRMKLNSWRTIDKVHIRDMIGVGLIDSSWPARFQPQLAARLQELLDDPDG